MAEKENIKILAQNKKARHDYFIEETLEAGIELCGTPVGLVIIRDRPEDGYPYSFTGLFIADDFQQKGLGREAVEAIMNKFRTEGIKYRRWSRPLLYTIYIRKSDKPHRISCSYP